MRRVAMNLAADRHRRRRRQVAALHRAGPPPSVPPLSVEEVAAALGTRGGTVKSWLARGRRTLAARLGEPEEVGNAP